MVDGSASAVIQATAARVRQALTDSAKAPPHHPTTAALPALMTEIERQVQPICMELTTVPVQMLLLSRNTQLNSDQRSIAPGMQHIACLPMQKLIP